MSRNASGTYSLVAGNPVVTGTVISSTWANNTLNDIATALTDSLDRNGKGAMLAALKSVSGSAAAPGLTFDSANNAGFSLLAAAGDVPAGVGMSYAGAEVARVATGQFYVSAGKITGVAPLAPTATSLHLQSSVTNGPTYVNVIPNGTSYIAGVRAVDNSNLTAAAGAAVMRTDVIGISKPRAIFAAAGVNGETDVSVTVDVWSGSASYSAITIGGTGAAGGGGSLDLFLGISGFSGGTNGYVYLQAKNGAPGGGDVPDYGGTDRVAVYYDRANHRLYANYFGTWRYVQFV